MTLDFEKSIIEIDKRIDDLKKTSKDSNIDISAQIAKLEKTKNEIKIKIYSSLSPWQIVQLARHPKRPYTFDYINLIFNDFVELHGDRYFGDDKAILSGIAEIDNRQVVVIGHQKGRTLDENIKGANFGMAHPEGYRKALRVMKLAEKFNRPVITFIDTPGAYPGIAAEERGQAEAIAKNLREMSCLKVPIITIIISEGGSGGALGIAVSNKIFCLENSYCSVISPEGCAAILFRDSSKAAEAAEAMKITAKDLLNLKIVDGIIKEPLGGAHNDVKKTALNIKKILNENLAYYDNMSCKKIINDRYSKFRSFGIFDDIFLKNKQ